MKIITVIGARPQFVKAAVVSRAIEQHNKKNDHPKIEEKIVHTGQHFDKNMSAIFFDQMDIPEPHYNLEINSLSHGAMTGKMLEEIEKVILKENPDWVLVYGDTNSTLAGALAAKKLHVKVAHVEAGLRSFNMAMPEEINRILTDRISDILFCPTETAIDNLTKEGYLNINSKRIQCGDVMNDAAIYYSSSSTKPKSVTENHSFVLSTIHRQENTDFKEKLTSIFEALESIAENERIIIPLHPRTIGKLKEFNIVPSENIELIEPVGYFEMIWLLSNCTAVITDSGGLQKEAFFFGKPCITVREETEWVELVNNGVNLLAGSNKQSIFEKYNFIKKAIINFNIDLYGTGNTGQIIVSELVKYDNH